jgi:hypothetical protein
MLALLASFACTPAVLAAPPEPPLTSHASFDGTVDAVSRGEGKPVKVEGPVEFRPGKVGQALLCGDGGALLWYASAGVLRANSGTVEMWVCPLDWTGDEDEFHVFLEALNPGWLVFYRYYQGGILTLMGTDGKTYRGAAGPQIKWTPGEWHHLAGTWRAKRLEVYVDGERAGAADDPPMPDQLADTFRLGDHPWHVPRVGPKHTLIDEVKVYSVPLDAESIAKAAHGEAFEYKPQIVLDVKADPDAGELNVACDAAGLVGELGAGRTGRVELLPKAGGASVTRAEIATFPKDMGQAKLPIADLAEGEYEVRASLLDGAGAVVAKQSAPFHKPGPPVWSGNKLGMEDEVLPPWTALKTDRARATVGCWGRRYEFGAFLKGASSLDTELVRPVVLEAVVNGQTVAFPDRAARVEEASDTRALLSGTSEAGGMSLTTRHQVDFDGFTWTDLTLDAGEGVKVEELRLFWSMPAAEARLMHADQMKWSANPAGALKPEGWSSDWTHFFWLGNEDRGLAWYAESPRNWVASKDRPAIEVKPEGEQVNVTLRLIAEPTELKGKVEYGFGFMATPARPRPDDARRWRMVPAPRPTFEITWPNENMKWYGYPEPIDPEKYAEHVKASHEKGVQVVPYVNLNYCSGGAPEWQYYGSRWASDPPRGVLPSDVAAMGFSAMGTCPANRDWQDFILYRIDEAIRKYGIDGIYIDCWCPYDCQAGPCAWTDAAGKSQHTRPIRAYREIIRRVYSLFRHTRPNPLLMVHMSSEVNIPMLSFTDTILDGEQFGPGKLVADYLDVLPPDAFRAEFLGRNFGPVEFFLPEFRPPNEQPGTLNLAPYLLLHDVNPWPIWSDGATWTKLYEALDAFALTEAEFRPYWLGSGVQAPPGVLVSSYVREGRALLAVVNTGEATEARLTADPKRLKLAGLATASDVLLGDTLKVEASTLTVPLARHQGRMVELHP